MHNPNQMVQDFVDEEGRISVQAIIGEQPIGLGQGTISASDSKADNAQELAESLAHAIERHIVTVDPEAPVTCIDGRCAKCCADGLETEPRPSVAGGAWATAYAAAELVGWFAQDMDKDRIARMKLVREYLGKAEIAVGAHCDTDSVENNFAHGTGCGAIDKMPDILQVLHENKTNVDSIAGSVLGDDAEGVVQPEYVPARVLAARLENWDKKTLHDMIVTENPHGIEVLQGDPNSATHGHAEQAVVFNFVEGTTVDRDELYKDTGKQVFVVDVWSLRKIAAALAAGPEATVQKRYLLHAMMAYQVATYLTLCDGSQRPVFIKP